MSQQKFLLKNFFPRTEEMWNKCLVLVFQQHVNYLFNLLVQKCCLNNKYIQYFQNISHLYIVGRDNMESNAYVQRQLIKITEDFLIQLFYYQIIKILELGYIGKKKKQQTNKQKKSLF